MNFEILVNSIEQTHQHFQQQATKAINVALSVRNWLIGYYIVEFEQNGDERAQYGEKLLARLAERCVHIKGLDERSFRNFRLFYQYYPQISDTLSGVLPDLPIRGSLTTESKAIDLPVLPNWRSLTAGLKNTENRLSGKVIIHKLSYTHLEQLLRLDENLKRTFYEIECINGNWSVRELKRQINSLYFERSGMSQNPQKLQMIANEKAETFLPANVVKSLYAFEFLGLQAKDAIEESDLETALLDHLQEFMLEMGNGFCFEARQKKILIGDEYFFVDLVFYHRILKCHVLVELKVEAFDHNNIGQLNTYVNYFKSEIMRTDDNPTIGILLVTHKNKALVEYATAGMDNHLFVSKYLLQLPDKEKLAGFIQQEIAKWKD